MIYRIKKQNQVEEPTVSVVQKPIDVSVLKDDNVKLIIGRLSYLQQRLEELTNKKNQDRQIEVVCSRMHVILEKFDYSGRIEKLEEKIDKLLKLKAEEKIIITESQIDTESDFGSEPDVNISYNFAKSKLEYKEGARISKPDMTVYFRDYVKRKFDLTRTQEKLSPTDIALADDRLEFKREKICKHCRNRHLKGCC